MNRKGVVWDTLIPWLIGLAVLVLGFVLYQALYGKGQGIIEYVKDFVRFGR